MSALEDAGVDDDRIDSGAADPVVLLCELRGGLLDLALVVDIPGHDVDAVLVGGLGGEGMQLRGVGRVPDAGDDAAPGLGGQQSAGVAESEAAGGACGSN